MLGGSRVSPLPPPRPLEPATSFPPRFLLAPLVSRVLSFGKDFINHSLILFCFRFAVFLPLFLLPPGFLTPVSTKAFPRRIDTLRRQPLDRGVHPAYSLLGACFHSRADR